jgi:hypothetical protein
VVDLLDRVAPAGRDRPVKDVVINGVAVTES